MIAKCGAIPVPVSDRPVGRAMNASISSFRFAMFLAGAGTDAAGVDVPDVNADIFGGSDAPV